MKRYCVKCRTDRVEYIDVVKEVPDGYLIRLTRISDGIKKTTEDTMTKHLFKICLKTGFIHEFISKAASVA